MDVGAKLGDSLGMREVVSMCSFKERFPMHQDFAKDCLDRDCANFVMYFECEGSFSIKSWLCIPPVNLWRPI